jgi:hypothetical protein
MGRAEEVEVGNAEAKRELEDVVEVAVEDVDGIIENGQGVSRCRRGRECVSQHSFLYFY